MINSVIRINHITQKKNRRNGTRKSANYLYGRLDHDIHHRGKIFCDRLKCHRSGTQSCRFYNM